MLYDIGGVRLPTTPHKAGGQRGVAGVAREPMRGTKWVQGTEAGTGHGQDRVWTRTREDGAGGMGRMGGL